MKKQLLTAIAVGLSLCGYAQTKGTSTLGLGANITSYKSSNKYNNTESTSTDKNRYFNLGYGYFVEDNTRLGLELSYGHNKVIQPSSDYEYTIRTYGVNISYQKYYPLVKTLYAYAGAKTGYSKSKSVDENVNYNRSEANAYHLGAYGGLTWFVSKRFAFETNLLSADIAYQQTKITRQDQSYEVKQENTGFNLNTQGLIDNLGFKIYLQF